MKRAMSVAVARTGAAGAPWDPLEVNSLVVAVAVVIAPRIVGHQRRRQRLDRGAVLHGQRFENMLGDVRLERLAGDALDDVAGQRRAVVGVGKPLSRRIDALRHGLDQKITQRLEILRTGNVDGRQLFLEAGRVRHQVCQGDGLGNLIPNLITSERGRAWPES